MESKPHVSAREIQILRIYGMAAALVLVAYFLLGWLREGAPVKAFGPYHAEIAVLVPLTGEGSEDGMDLLNLVNQAKNQLKEELGLDEWNITVYGHDTGGTPASAAWAAFRAARNPNTVAIVGPLDARLLVAVKNTVEGKNIPVITVSSTTPALDLTAAQGVYRIPSTDDYQGPALVRFLVTKGYTDVFLLVEPGDYTQNVLSSFMDAANNRVRFVGSVQIPAGNDAFDARHVQESNAEAVVYLGGVGGLERILQELEQANLLIPIVGLDSLNDPKVASLLADGQELFFTSPIYVNTSIPGPYRELPADRDAGLYSLESVEATWFILDALSSDDTDGYGRTAAWQNLAGATIQGLDGGRLRWNHGQLWPISIYVYRGTARETGWFSTPVFVFHTQ